MLPNVAKPRVHIVDYSDRPYLQLEWKDLGTGRRRFWSTKTNDRNEAALMARNKEKSLCKQWTTLRLMGHLASRTFETPPVGFEMCGHPGGIMFCDTYFYESGRHVYFAECKFKTTLAAYRFDTAIKIGTAAKPTTRVLNLFPKDKRELLKSVALIAVVPNGGDGLESYLHMCLRWDEAQCCPVLGGKETYWATPFVKMLAYGAKEACGVDEWW